MPAEQPAHTRDQGCEKRQGPYQEPAVVASIAFLGMDGPHGTWSGGASTKPEWMVAAKAIRVAISVQSA